MSTPTKSVVPAVKVARKPVSPAAPSYTLGDCLTDSKKLYEAYGRGKFSVAEFASTLSISANSGPTSARIFTLKEYGFLLKEGLSFKLSEELILLKGLDKDSPEFKRSAFAAVKHAKLFSELIQEFSSRLPPTATLIARLEGQKKFNADRAKQIANLFETSLRFAGVVDGSNNIVPPREDASNGTVPEETIPQSQGANPSLQEETKPNIPNALKTEIPLKDNRRAVVFYPEDLIDSEAKKVGAVLLALVTE